MALSESLKQGVVNIAGSVVNMVGIHKKRILEVYLNVIEMGDGIFGIESAANHYFKKPAKNLSRQESALIAACLPSPRRYRVSPPSNYVLGRSQWVMRQMSFLEPDPDIQRIIQ